MSHNTNVEDRSFNANVDPTTRQGNLWDPGENIPPPPPDLTAVVVSPATADLAPAGTAQLSAAPEPPEADLGEVGWASSDEAVATVDAAGLVTAVAAGTATVTGTSGEASGTSTVTVTAPVEE